MANENLENKRKYFFKMGEEERQIVKKWYKENKKDFITFNRIFFFDQVGRALEEIDYDYWIATIEPSISDEKLYYRKDSRVARGFDKSDWPGLARAFAPELGSRLATERELYIWYAYRIAKRYWKIEFVCDYSDSGNYKNNIGASGRLERSGQREIGFFADGTGNTLKIVFSTVCSSKRSKELVEGEYTPALSAIGGYYEQEGDICPVSIGYNLEREQDEYLGYYGVGVVVLTK